MNERTNRLLASDEPKRLPGVPASVEYHRLLVTQKRRVLRGLLTIVLLIVGLIGFAQLFLLAAQTMDSQLLGRNGFTPLQQAAGALSLAALIPYSMLLQRVLYGVPARTLHSVAGRLRFGVLGRAMLTFGPVLVIVMAIGLVEPAPTASWTTPDLVAFFLIGVLLIPLAAAGEEYAFRGLMFRVVGSWPRGSSWGAAIGILATTAFFTLFHGSFDPFILTSYLVLFGSLAIITWRTGGLEVAIVLHAVYNATVLVLATSLHLDLGGALSSRAEADGSPLTLIPSLALIAITAVVWWLSRGTGPARTPSSATR
jgi:membrane protease YdiL (CAAX protease family)